MNTFKISITAITLCCTNLWAANESPAPRFFKTIVNEIPVTPHVAGLGYTNMAGNTGNFKQVTLGIVKSGAANNLQIDRRYRECSVRFEGDKISIVARLADAANGFRQSFESDYTNGDGFDVFPAMIPESKLQNHGESEAHSSAWVFYTNTGFNFRFKTIDNVRVDMQRTDIRKVTMKVRNVRLLSERYVQCDFGPEKNKYGY